MSYKKTFETHLKNYLTSKGIVKEIPISYSDFEDYQYQTSIGLSLRKEIKGFDPQDIGEYLKSNYKDFYSNISVTGPGFVSVKFNLSIQENKKETKQKVIVDYCGVNVAKQMHIGHIRSMFIGDYIVRLHEKMNDDVVIFNHIGDWGNQFGYLLNYIITNKLENELSNKNLTEYYKKATLQMKEDETFAKESEGISYKLQNNLDKTIYDLWVKLVNVSMTEAEKTFNELNLKVNLSHTKGESFYAPFCKKILNDLLTKNIAKKSEDGSVVCFFEDKTPIVLQKSNGNFLYALYDLAAIKWRVSNVNPDKMIYVVDKRQSLHFEQVFDIAKKANYAGSNVEMLHVGFGTILDKNKKPLKTKEGQSLYLDDLFAEGKSKLLETDYFKEIPDDMKNEILNKSIVGGMKYYDLKFNKSQDYMFDWQHVLNFSGGSAPYIQNALVRIDSIFEKSGKDISNYQEFLWDNEWSDLEKEMIFQCQKAEEVIFESDKNYASQTLCENLIKICQLFHKYYESGYILGSEKEDIKLNLLAYTFNSLNKYIDILGIESYPCKQKMLKNKIKNKI
jgi:arginyl-tRNA synthetase